MKRIAWREMKGRNILLLGLATLLFGCEGRSATDEAGLLDAVAYVTGGQQEGAQPQGFETRWRRTVDGREVRYESIRENPGFGDANEPHRDSRHVKVGVSMLLGRSRAACEIISPCSAGSVHHRC